jgi:glutathione S-transferase
MRILASTTSPYARIARIALAEKGFDISSAEFVNPWSDPEPLLKINTAARVPTLELDNGLPITESLLILLWLEKKRPEPSLLGGDLDILISQTGRAMGVIDAMTQILTFSRQYDSGFADHSVGLRRRRSIIDGMAALEAEPPSYASETPSIAVLTTIVALDYLRMRFPEAPWAAPTPHLDALRTHVADRPAYKTTEPHVS